MTGYLLDTHVLIWWLTDRSSIGARAAEVIGDARVPIWISAVVAWEMSIKSARVVAGSG